MKTTVHRKIQYFQIMLSLKKNWKGNWNVYTQTILLIDADFDSNNVNENVDWSWPYPFCFSTLYNFLPNKATHICEISLKRGNVDLWDGISPECVLLIFEEIFCRLQCILTHSNNKNYTVLIVYSDCQCWCQF